MKYTLLLVLLYVVTLAVTPLQSQVQLFSLSSSSDAGERLLNDLRQQINHHGPCWLAAVEKLETSCSSLNEDSQHRLAMAFTSCFLQKMGHSGYSCDENEDIKACVDHNNLSSSGHLGVYSTFYTHAHIICSFLQQQRWQGVTLDIINALSESSSDLSGQLNSLNEVVASTKVDQDRLQEYTKMALHENQKLTEKLSSQGSSMSVMLDQIHYVNTVIAGHASTLSSFAYFIGLVVVSFLLTTSEQTKQIRPWLLLLFTTNLLIELAILQWALDISGLSHEYFKPDNPISFRLSVCRRTFCCISFVFYLYKAVTYRSPEERSHLLLLEMSSSVSALDHRLQRIEMALISAASRVRKTYDRVDSSRGFREVTPLGTRPRSSVKDRTADSRPAGHQRDGGSDERGTENYDGNPQDKANHEVHRRMDRSSKTPQTEITSRERFAKRNATTDTPSPSPRRSFRIRSPISEKY